MKLNPSETAPKNSVILGKFGDNPYMLAAIWNPMFGAWSVARPRIVVSLDDGTTSVTMDEYSTLNRFVGWLPMPQIDDQGNVI